MTTTAPTDAKIIENACEALGAVAEIIESTYHHDEGGNRTNQDSPASGADVIQDLCGIEGPVFASLSELDGLGRLDDARGIVLRDLIPWAARAIDGHQNAGIGRRILHRANKLAYPTGTGMYLHAREARANEELWERQQDDALVTARQTLLTLSNHTAFEDDAPEFNEGGIGYETLKVLRTAIERVGV